MAAVVLCHHCRDLCLGWRWALSEAGMGGGARVVGAHWFTHTEVKAVAQLQEAEAYCESNLQLGVCGVCTSLQELGWFAGFVKLAVVAPCLPFLSSAACLPPQVTLRPTKATEWWSSESAAASELAPDLCGEVRNVHRKQRGSLWLVKSAVDSSSALKPFGRNG